MSEKRVIYRTEEGGMVVLTPAPEALEKYTIEQLAEKDVPEGVPYKIVDVSEIPSDRAFRNAWEIDEAELTDGFGGSITSFDEGQNGD
jgi:hypothetical protein